MAIIGSGPDAVLAHAAFERRMGVSVTDAQALAGHLAEALAELEDGRDESGIVASECDLTSAARKVGDACKSKRDGEDCAACQVIRAEQLMDCGMGDKARASGKSCAGNFAEDCGECRLYRAKLREDCGLKYDEYSKGAACKAYDGDADFQNCGCCRVRNAEHDLRLEIEAERKDAARVDGADFDRRDEEIAGLREQLDCGVERTPASVCKFRDDPLRAICAECSIHGLGLLTDAKIAELRTTLAGVEHERDFLRGERDRLVLAADAPKPKPAPVVRAAKPGQAAIDFGAAPAAPTVAKGRPCGCAGRGAHRKTCAEYKAPVRKARRHLLPAGAT